jgi:Lon protease-like protein
MPDNLEEMALFPLDTVLFPFASVRLHVFEDRYRQLVRDCLALDRPFGIVLIRRGPSAGGVSEPYLVGTAARIQKVHTYDDGRMDIHVLGDGRFRIRAFDDSQPYLVGKVEPVIEHSVREGAESDWLIEQARDIFESYIQQKFARQDFAVQVVFPPDPLSLSFTIANFLEMENLEKQRMLETTDTIERIGDLLPILQAQLLDLEREILEAQPPSFYKLSSEDLSSWFLPN